jgi:hypothetical protein
MALACRYPHVLDPKMLRKSGRFAWTSTLSLASNCAMMSSLQFVCRIEPPGVV